MAFALQYQSEPKTIVLNHLSSNPQHEWDDFRRYCRGSRHVQRHIFKEVKADMQLRGLIPIIPGDKAYNIVRREVEQELKAKQEEEALAAASAPAPTPAPTPEPSPAAPAPAAELAKDNGDIDWESIPDEPAEILRSAIDGKRMVSRGGITSRIRYDMEIMIKEMPDLAVKELLQAFHLPEDRGPAVSMIRDRVRKAINYTPTHGVSSMPVTSKENEALYAKCRGDLANLSKSDVSSLNLVSYRDRFKRPSMTSQIFNNVKTSMIRAWENGQGPAANRPAAATESGSFGSGLAPRPPATNGKGRHPVPEGPILAPGVVICKIDDAKYADAERKTLRNILPEAIRESLRLFGVTCPPLTTALVELEDDTKVLELRVK